MSLPAGGVDVAMTAGEAMTTAFVNVTRDTGTRKVKLAGAGEKVFGILQAAVASGEEATIRTSGFSYNVIADATSSIDDYLASDASAKGTVTTTDLAEVYAQVVDATTAADNITVVEIKKFTLSAS